MSDTSESTLEEVSIERILDVLDLAAHDATESGDYLTYGTVLDVYLGNPLQYKIDEREQLLQLLLLAFILDPKLVYEAGWDLPPLLLRFIDLDYDFDAPIRFAPCIYRVLKLFELLAVWGNHKELLLKACECVSTLLVSHLSVVTEDESHQMKFFEIKVYCLFELMSVCLRGIRGTLPEALKTTSSNTGTISTPVKSPLKFLAMAATAIVNMVASNGLNRLDYWTFMLKRVYIFCRTYTDGAILGVKNNVPLKLFREFDDEDSSEKSELVAPAPAEGDDNLHSLKPTSIDKIVVQLEEDEEDAAIQRKLLTSLLTQTIQLVGRNYLFGYSMDIVTMLQTPLRPQLEKYFDYTVDNESMNRLISLAQSFDIDLGGQFASYIVDSHKLFHSVNLKTSDPSDLFLAIINDYQTNVHSTIVNSTGTGITDSVIGCLILATHQVASSKNFDSIKLTFGDALVLSVRSIVPGMIQPKLFLSKALYDCCAYWSWLTIHLQLTREVELQLQRVPPLLLTVYFQSLLFACVSSTTNSNFRYVTLTLLTRVLSLSPEDAVYSFLIDSLNDCPYENIKAALAGVLRQLLTQNRAVENADEITKKMGGLSTSSLGPTSAPALPPRVVKYIKLTPGRANDIFDLVMDNLTTAFQFGEGLVSVDGPKFLTLSSLLNLLVVCRTDPIMKETEQKERLKDVLLEVLTVIKKVKDISDEPPTANAADILKIALERIRA